MSSIDAISAFYDKVKLGWQVAIFSVEIIVDMDGGFKPTGNRTKVVELKKASIPRQKKLSEGCAPDSDSTDTRDDGGQNMNGDGQGEPETADPDLMLGANLLIEEAEQNGFDTGDDEQSLNLHGLDAFDAALAGAAAAFMSSDCHEGEDNLEASIIENDFGQVEKKKLHAAMEKNKFTDSQVNAMAERFIEVTGGDDGSGQHFLTREDAVSEAVMNHQDASGCMDFAEVLTSGNAGVPSKGKMGFGSGWCAVASNLEHVNHFQS